MWPICLYNYWEAPSSIRPLWSWCPTAVLRRWCQSIGAEGAGHETGPIFAETLRTSATRSTPSSGATSCRRDFWMIATTSFFLAQVRSFGGTFPGRPENSWPGPDLVVIPRLLTCMTDHGPRSGFGGRSLRVTSSWIRPWPSPMPQFCCARPRFRHLSQQRGSPSCRTLKVSPRGNWRKACDRAGITFLDSTADPLETIAKIRGSRLVISEAMHGAIVADALRTPWVARASDPYRPPIQSGL